jgi:hypothetical protein
MSNWQKFRPSLFKDFVFTGRNPSNYLVCLEFLIENHLKLKYDDIWFDLPRKRSKEESEEGEIVHLDPSKSYGFIRSGLQRVYFQFRFVINSSDENVELHKGLVVKFDWTDKRGLNLNC